MYKLGESPIRVYYFTSKTDLGDSDRDNFQRLDLVSVSKNDEGDSIDIELEWRGDVQDVSEHSTVVTTEPASNLGACEAVL